jgi:hypothetical protein
MVIGTRGNTGSSSGAHLHFSIFILEAGDWKVIDPFGWKPVPGADVTVDPWSLSASGTESWCIWERGKWVHHCSDYPEFYPVTTIPDPALMSALSENGIVVEDSLINNNTFSKGYGGLWLNPCNNLNPTCRDWFDSLAGSGGHTLRTIADGVNTADNWVKWQPGLPSNYSDLYEVFVYVPDIAGYTDDTFTWQAKYKVVDGNGTTYEAIVDQYTGDKWLSIGSYYLVGTSNTSYVYLTDATGEAGNTHCPNGPVNNNQHWCRLAVDAIKFVKLGIRYAPDISASIPGRFSEVVLSNPSSAPAKYKVSFFDAAGTYCGGVWNPAVPPQGQVVVSTECPPAAYAVVSADRDLATVVEYTDSSGPSYSYNAIAAMDPSNPGWGEIGEPMHLPIIMQNYWTWYSFGYLLNPKNSAVICEIRSAYPVAVVVNQSTSISPVRSCSYSASQIGSDYVLLPDIVHKSDFGGNQDWVSSVNLQNVGDESEIYHIRFRRASGSLALYNAVEIQPGG